ncbi:CAP domain-containing protein [Piscinibacter sakaiensis]|uniref:SCP domain-containing protein n=1 Tax=Piscinibacter sakaiensis TaxID=1547922 RepID=A0A0K8P015_PISS1|nr:CAP domain-containing protein [Piscinibacter sakaiensis]GAP35879.1 hypothetical protein ISF6_1719 [Piscinibacter sakaiensis]
MPAVPTFLARAALVPLLALAACAGRPGSPPSVASPACPALSSGERARLQAVVDELNLARTRPQAYAQVVAQQYASLGRDRSYRRGDQRVLTAEGRPAVDEAIAWLRRAEPRPPLVLNTCLSHAAQDHAADLGRSGGLGHQGSDRSLPSDRAARRLGRPAACGENISFGQESPREHVAALIVDDDVPGRGHRTNIFDPGYRSIGVGLGPHPGYRTVNVNLMCLESLPG